MPLHGQCGDLVAGLLQAADVAAQVAPAHLRSLQELTVEISWGFGEFGEVAHTELLVVGDGSSVEVADPPALENPGFL